jgi:RNA polymerase sigma factor (sigma-70 family)
MSFDRADLEQELLLAVWLKLRHFDPLRASLPTFVEKVCSTRSASIFRRTKAAKRTPPSLDPPRLRAFDINITVEIQVDFRRALGTLGRADQKIARLLLNHMRPAEIARMLGIPRAGVYRSIERIRAALKHFELEKY